MYATIEGVVRAPSEFSMTLGCPPSMMATQLFVVPRSMPMIFAMCGSSGIRDAYLCIRWGFARSTQGADSSTAAGFRHHHHRRTHHPIVQVIALLHDLHDRVLRLVARHRGDRLVGVRIEPLSDRIDLGELRLLERGVELLQGELDTGAQRLGIGVTVGEGRLQRVLHREQAFGELLDAIAMRLGDIGLPLAADVLGVGARPQVRLLHRGGLVFGLLEQGHDVGGWITVRTVGHDLGPAVIGWNGWTAAIGGSRGVVEWIRVHDVFGLEKAKTPARTARPPGGPESPRPGQHDYGGASRPFNGRRRSPPVWPRGPA